MSSAQEILAAGPVSFKVPGGPRRHRRLHRVEFRWAIAFAMPYLAVFFAFVAYPFGYALWLAGRPSIYADLFSDPLYAGTLVNTLLFVGVGANLKMFLALLLSGFFMRQRWWIRALLPVYLLPWLIAAAQACVSIHWMLIGQWGLLDELLWKLFGVAGPEWLGNRWLALGANIAAYIWRWMPFWTVIFLVARATIPRDIYDAAAVDGSTGWRAFVHVTFPLLANLYLVCTLLSTLWMLGEFTTPYLVSSAAPGDSTEVLATLGFHYAFDLAEPALGVAVVLSALPILIPIVIVLMRRFHRNEVQL